jgi:hypothetical protein
MIHAHTPAPWAFERAVEANGSVTFDIFNIATEACNRSGECVAYIQTYSEQQAAVQEANARLIAASPNMYLFIKKRAENGDIEAQNVLKEINA